MRICTLAACLVLALSITVGHTQVEAAATNKLPKCPTERPKIPKCTQDRTMTQDEAEAQCRYEAECLGLKRGGGKPKDYKFSGNYKTKGCYKYTNENHPNFPGMAYFGENGDFQDWTEEGEQGPKTKIALYCFCYEEDTAYIGESIPDGYHKTNDPEECAFKCEKAIDCQTWAYRPEQAYPCVLQYNFYAGKNPYREEGTTSGVKPSLCGKVPDCFEFATKYEGDDLAGYDLELVDTWQKCEQKCKKTDGCLFFTYGYSRGDADNKKCWLKTGRNNKSAFNPYVSGSINCSRSSTGTSMTTTTAAPPTFQTTKAPTPTPTPSSVSG